MQTNERQIKHMLDFYQMAKADETKGIGLTIFLSRRIAAVQKFQPTCHDTVVLKQVSYFSMGLPEMMSKRLMCSMLCL